MTVKELGLAASTLWVVVAAVLVLFMQAGFAFLEAGLTRMKNVGHIAAKNALVLAVAAIVFYLVGFGMAFGDGGNGFVGGSGFFPNVDDLLAVGEAPFSWFGAIPAGVALLFQTAFAAVSLAIVWGAMAERTRLWVYPAFGVAYVLVYSIVAHWIWSSDGWLFDLGMQDFAGSTVVHYQGALAGLAGALLLGPRIGKFSGGQAQAIPGHNMAYTTLGVFILWFGWFGFNPGSTLSVDYGGVGFFGYVALNTNLAACAGVLGATIAAWLLIKKPDLSMMLNGAIGALVAITAACAFVAPWAAIVIGFVAGVIVVLGVLLVERVGIDDPVGALAAHGMAGVWGTLSLGFLAMPKLAENLDWGQGGLLYGGGGRQLGVQALGLLVVGAFTFTASFLILLLFKLTVGIRTEPEVEEQGLDVSEHGMWGYPEFYIPVPGGYGSEHHVAVTGDRYEDGAVIVAEGTPGESMYVVQSGSVEIVKARDDGSEQRLATLKPGEFFGEMAIFEGELRSATVRAVGETRVVEVDKKTVKKRIQDDPGLAVNLLRTMSSRLREANDHRTGAAEAGH